MILPTAPHRRHRHHQRRVPRLLLRLCQHRHHGGDDDDDRAAPLVGALKWWWILLLVLLVLFGLLLLVLNLSSSSSSRFQMMIHTSSIQQRQQNNSNNSSNNKQSISRTTITTTILASPAIQDSNHHDDTGNHTMYVPAYCLANMNNNHHNSNNSTIVPCPTTKHIRWIQTITTKPPATATAATTTTTTTTTTTMTILLQTLDYLGHNKSIGGDEFYITFHDHQHDHLTTTIGSSLASSSADHKNTYNNQIPIKSSSSLFKTNTTTSKSVIDGVATIQDHNDGTYTLEFFIPPMTNVPRDSPKSVLSSMGMNTTTSNHYTNMLGGIITIYHQYTCGIGKIVPPHKNTWETSGAINRIYTLRVPTSPYLRPYIHPNKNYPNNNDRMMMKKQESKIHMELYDTVYFFGDSVMQQFIQYQNQYFILPSNRTLIRGNVGMELSNQTVSMFLRKFHRWYGKELNSLSSSTTTTTISMTPNSTKRIGLVMGSSTWDILQPYNIQQGLHYDDHIEACRTLIQSIQKRYPYIQLFWKSPSAMHIHAVQCKGGNNSSSSSIEDYQRIRSCEQRVRYMSTSRVEYLYQRQKQLMKELSIPYLDLYLAYYLSASECYPGDGRHYQASFNAMMLSWYYTNTTIIMK